MLKKDILIETRKKPQSKEKIELKYTFYKNN